MTGMLAVRETRTFPEGLEAEAARDQRPSIGKRLRAGARRSPPASVPSTLLLTVNVLAKWTEDSLIADGWIHERPCRVIIDTGASVTIARPDIVAGLPERKSNLPYVLQTASGETIPVIREARVELTLGRRPVRIWVLVADITDELILGLDVLRACDASVDVGRHVLGMGREEVSLWNPRARPRSSRLTLLNDEVNPM
jgi:predicted aspartyl protease